MKLTYNSISYPTVEHCFKFGIKIVLSSLFIQPKLHACYFIAYLLHKNKIKVF